jgi:hypothetical protein
VNNKEKIYKEIEKDNVKSEKNEWFEELKSIKWRGISEFWKKRRRKGTAGRWHLTPSGQAPLLSEPQVTKLVDFLMGMKQVSKTHSIRSSENRFDFFPKWTICGIINTREALFTQTGIFRGFFLYIYLL